ncbi:phage tail tape measure protein [Thiohalobacter thiocyanaticus]|uniref:Phage tail tape measure protein n=1 Tax=Thiohalobacter thiocyanaticus TaxID=585455 RepID=A0A426QMC4_9GAMM|nr:phage tail tape measure protein [Thiohalobacter thiocyanaticus]RRQ22908.1 phage tail tape measure protein [Thiohalobacter thiocyanaticus]
MADLAELALVVRSDQVERGSRRLEQFTRAGSRAERGTRRITSATERLERNVSRTLGPLRAMTGLLAGIGVSVGLGSIIREFAAFEQGLIGIGKTADLTGRDLEEMGNRVQEIARRVPVATTELLSIGQAAGQLGVKGVDNIARFTETVGKLGLASDLSGEQAATSLARILTVTGTAVSDVDRLGSTVVQLGNNFAATESEIASAATRIAQSTAQFQTTASEVAGIGAALRAVGVEAEAGGTVIGRAFQSINDAVRQGGQELDQFQKITGLTSDQLQDLFTESPTQAFQAFVEGLGRIQESGGDVTSALSSVGLEGVRVVQVLGTLATRSDVLFEALQKANEEWERNTALNEEAEKAASALNAQLDLLGNAASEAATAFGTMIEPDVTASVRAATEALNALARNMDTLATVAGVVGIAIGSRLTAAVASSTAGFVRNQAAAVANARALAEQSAFNLQAARSQLVMARNMELGTGSMVRQQAAVRNLAVAWAAHQTNLQRASVTARAAAASMTVLNRAMAFLGGPLGVAITGVATAMFLFRDSAEAAAVETESLAERVDRLTGSMRDLRREQLESLASDIQSEMAGIAETIQQQQERLERISKTNTQPVITGAINEIKALGSEYGGLLEQLQRVQAELDKLDKQNKKAGGSTDDLGDSAKKAANELQSLMDRLFPLQARAQQFAEERNQLLAAGFGESSEAVQRLEEEFANATGGNRTLSDSVKKTAEETKNLGKEGEQVAQIFEDTASGIQRAFASTFRDIFDEGLDGFDDLGDRMLDVFKDMLAQMATLAIAEPIIVPVVQQMGRGMGLGQNQISQVTGQLGGGGLNIPGAGLLGDTFGTAAGNFLPAFGVTSLAGNALGLGDSTTTGAALGAGLGAAVPGFGAGAGGLMSLSGLLGPAGIIGLAVGALAGSIFDGGKTKLGFETTGGPPTKGARSFETPFGTINPTRGRNLNTSDILSQLASVDEQLASLLSPEQISRVGSGIQGTSQFISRSSFEGKDAFSIFETRLTRIIDSLSGNRQASRLLDSVPRGGDNIDDLVSRAQQVVQMITQIQGLEAEPLNEAEQAIQQLNRQFDELANAADQLGFGMATVERRRQEELRRLTTDFNRSISQQILAITDPLELALQQQEEAAQRRLENARTLGADLAEVERLSALERQQIIERFGDNTASKLQQDLERANTSIERFLTDLTSGSRSPLSPTARLSNAESEFERLLQQARGGDVEARQDITRAADNLLQASRDVFGSTEQFFQRFDFIQATLSNLVGQGGDSSQATLENIGVTISQGNAEMAFLTKELISEVKELRSVVADQQETITRLAAA